MKTPKMNSLKALVGTLIAASCALQAAPALADITKDQRVLVVVAELDGAVPQELKPFYSIIEDLSAGIAGGLLGTQYREVKMLKGSNATLAKYKSTLRALALRPEVKAIDTIISLHGSNNHLSFFEGSHSLAAVRDSLVQSSSALETATVVSMKRKLRMLYSTACFGASHRDEFIQIGYDVVAGAIGVDANAEVEFPSVTAQWAAGMGFKDAFAVTNNDAALAVSDGPVRFAGELANNSLKLTNSKKLFSGDISVQIRTEAR